MPRGHGGLCEIWHHMCYECTVAPHHFLSSRCGTPSTGKDHPVEHGSDASVHSIYNQTIDKALRISTAPSASDQVLGPQFHFLTLLLQVSLMGTRGCPA